MINAIEYLKTRNRATPVTPDIKDSTINFEKLKDAGFDTVGLIQLSEKGVLNIKYISEPMISFKSFNDLILRIENSIKKSKEYIKNKHVELKKLRDSSKYSKAEAAANGIEMATKRILAHESEIVNINDTYRSYLDNKISSNNRLIKLMKEITADFETWNKSAEKELKKMSNG